MNMIRLLPLLLAASVAANAQSLPNPRTLYFSLFDGKAGAVAAVQIDPATERVTKQPVLFRDEELFRATTLLPAGTTGDLLLINELNELPAVVRLRPSNGTLDPLRIPLPERPMQIVAHGQYALISGHEGGVFLVDVPAGKIAATLDLRKGPSPPAYRASHFLFSKDGTRALIAIAREQPERQPGHRLTVVEIPSLNPVASLEFERDQPQLHFPKGEKDNGPIPHLLLASQRTNTLAVLLLNYGQVHLADLDAAFDGRWENASRIPTSKDGTPGTSFPFTGTVFPAGDNDFAIISNASETGGSVLIDLKNRKLHQHLDSGPRGFHPPEFQASRNRLIAVHSGIQHSRGTEGVEDKHIEAHDLCLIDVAPLASGGEAALRRMVFADFIYGVTTLPGIDDRILLTTRRPSDSLLFQWVYDTRTREVVERLPSPGVVRNFVIHEQNSGR